MGIDICLWRARIGCFSMPGRRERFLAPAILVGARLRLAIRLATLVATLLVIAGDVERNPGPTQHENQNTSAGRAKGGSANSTMAQSRLSFGGPGNSDRTTRSVSRSQASCNPAQTPNPQMQQTDQRQNMSSDQKLDFLCEQIKGIGSLEHRLSRIETRLERNLDELWDRVGQLERENSTLKDTVTKLEEHSRRNNLIFHGIPESDRESWEETEMKVKVFMEEKLYISREDTDAIVIERAHRLGGRHTGVKPVIAKFLSYKDKDKVLTCAREKLRDDKDHGVREDYSARVRDIRKRLYPFLKDARDRDEQATLTYDKLKMNGTIYRYDEATQDIVPVRRVPRAAPRAQKAREPAAEIDPVDATHG